MDIEKTDSKATLEKLYHTHHVRGKRYGYLFCHGARAPYLQEWVGKGKKVLDLGCRDGMLTEAYAEGNEVTGVDIDRNALSLAEKRVGISTMWLDLNGEWPFAPESFDVIIACEIVEHLYYEREFYQKVARTLKPGGRFIGSVPNAFRMRNRMKFLFGKEFDADPTHVRSFSYHKLKNRLESHFSHVCIHPIQGKIAPGISVGRKTPLFLSRLFARDLLWRADVQSGDKSNA